MLLLTFIALGFGLMVVNFGRRNILIAIAAAVTWFALSMWLFFSDAAPFNLEDTYAQLLAWVFFLLMFVPLLLQLDTEIKHERNGYAFKTWGKQPKDRPLSAYEQYREILWNRTRPNRRKR